MLHAARCKYRTQKNRHLGTVAQICRAISLQLRHVSTIGKNLLSSDAFPTSPYNMVNFGPLAAEIGFTNLGHPSTFQQVSRLGSVTARHSSSRRHPNFAALNRGRHLCSAGRPSRWALAHILVSFSFHFYSARNCIASAVLATAIPSVCPSVCLSVTRRYCVKTLARSTVQFALSDSKMRLVL